MEGGGRRSGPRGRRPGGRPGGRGGPRGGRGPRRDDGDNRPSSAVVEDTELASRTVDMENKKILIDVKENSRGKFVKLSEINEAGSVVGRNKVTLSLSNVSTFVDSLSEFADFTPPQGEEVPEDGRLKSTMVQLDSKRYYFDLKENARGRFLRICQTTSMGGRQQVALPSTGIVPLRDNLKEVTDDQVVDAESPQQQQQQLPASRDVRVNRKRFYFDIGSNDRGVFMRISEVTSRYRSSVTIPQSGWVAVRDAVQDYIDQMPYVEPEEDNASPEPASSEV